MASYQPDNITSPVKMPTVNISQEGPRKRRNTISAVPASSSFSSAKDFNTHAATLIKPGNEMADQTNLGREKSAMLANDEETTTTTTTTDRSSAWLSACTPCLSCFHSASDCCEDLLSCFDYNREEERAKRRRLVGRRGLTTSKVDAALDGFAAQKYQPPLGTFERGEDLFTILTSKYYVKTFLPKESKTSLDRDHLLTSRKAFHFIEVFRTCRFGRVYIARPRNYTDWNWVKVVCKSDEMAVKSIKNELACMKVVEKEPFFLRLIGQFQTPSGFYIVSSFEGQCTLETMVLKNAPLSFSNARFYTSEIVSALAFLHGQAIIHRLSATNCMLDEDGHVVLVDFAFVVFDESTDLKLFDTPPYVYLAPEMIKGVKYDKTVDWWALGVIVYFMLYGSFPFKGDTSIKVLTQIMERTPDYPEHEDAKEAIAFCKQLLTKKCFNRLGFGASGTYSVIVHKFFRNLNWVHVNNKMLKPPYLPPISQARLLGSTDTQSICKARSNVSLAQWQDTDEVVGSDNLKASQKSKGVKKTHINMAQGGTNRFLPSYNLTPAGSNKASRSAFPVRSLSQCSRLTKTPDRGTSPIGSIASIRHQQLTDVTDRQLDLKKILTSSSSPRISEDLSTKNNTGRSPNQVEVSSGGSRQRRTAQLKVLGLDRSSDSPYNKNRNADVEEKPNNNCSADNNDLKELNQRSPYKRTMSLPYLFRSLNADRTFEMRPRTAEVSSLNKDCVTKEQRNPYGNEGLEKAEKRLTEVKRTSNYDNTTTYQCKPTSTPMLISPTQGPQNNKKILLEEDCKFKKETEEKISNTDFQKGQDKSESGEADFPLSSPVLTDREINKPKLEIDKNVPGYLEESASSETSEEQGQRAQINCAEEQRQYDCNSQGGTVFQRSKVLRSSCGGGDIVCMEIDEGSDGDPCQEKGCNLKNDKVSSNNNCNFKSFRGYNRNNNSNDEDSNNNNNDSDDEDENNDCSKPSCKHDDMQQAQVDTVSGECDTMAVPGIHKPRNACEPSTVSDKCVSMAVSNIQETLPVREARGSDTHELMTSLVLDGHKSKERSDSPDLSLASGVDKSEIRKLGFQKQNELHNDNEQKPVRRTCMLARTVNGNVHKPQSSNLNNLTAGHPYEKKKTVHKSKGQTKINVTADGGFSVKSSGEKNNQCRPGNRLRDARLQNECKFSTSPEKNTRNASFSGNCSVKEAQVTCVDETDHSDLSLRNLFQGINLDDVATIECDIGKIDTSLKKAKGKSEQKSKEQEKLAPVSTKAEADLNKKMLGPKSKEPKSAFFLNYITEQLECSDKGKQTVCYNRPRGKSFLCSIKTAPCKEKKRNHVARSLLLDDDDYYDSETVLARDAKSDNISYTSKRRPGTNFPITILPLDEKAIQTKNATTSPPAEKDDAVAIDKKVAKKKRSDFFNPETLSRALGSLGHRRSKQQRTSSDSKTTPKNPTVSTTFVRKPATPHQARRKMNISKSPAHAKKIKASLRSTPDSLSEDDLLDHDQSGGQITKVESSKNPPIQSNDEKALGSIRKNSQPDLPKLVLNSFVSYDVLNSSGDRPLGNGKIPNKNYSHFLDKGESSISLPCYPNPTGKMVSPTKKRASSTPSLGDNTKLFEERGVDDIKGKESVSPCVCEHADTENKTLFSTSGSIEQPVLNELGLLQEQDPATHAMQQHAAKGPPPTVDISTEGQSFTKPKAEATTAGIKPVHSFSTISDKASSKPAIRNSPSKDMHMFEADRRTSSASNSVTRFDFSKDTSGRHLCSHVGVDIIKELDYASPFPMNTTAEVKSHCDLFGSKLPDHVREVRDLWSATAKWVNACGDSHPGAPTTEQHSPSSYEGQGENKGQDIKTGTEPSSGVSEYSDDTGLSYAKERYERATRHRKKLMEAFDEITPCTEVFKYPKSDVCSRICRSGGSRNNLEFTAEISSLKSKDESSGDGQQVIGTLTIECLNPPVNGLIFRREI